MFQWYPWPDGDSSFARQKSRVRTNPTVPWNSGRSATAAWAFISDRARGWVSSGPFIPVSAITTGRSLTPNSLRTSSIRWAMFASYSSLNAWLIRSFQPWCQANPTTSTGRPARSGNVVPTPARTALVRVTTSV